MRPIAIGSDEAGFLLKEELRRYLEAGGYEVTDYGCHSTEPAEFAGGGSARKVGKIQAAERKAGAASAPSDPGAAPRAATKTSSKERAK